ncbi:response regulator transcription factor [Marinicella sp. W31]|uniref:response regulator transcription factor n=1 Tax=Marinicella sp. W31 TaxID=3023713 RepID=UPI00375752A4
MLIVDDDAVFVDILEEVLLDRGFVVKTALSASDVGQLCKAWTPAYAIVDLRIGTDSGLQVSMDLLAQFNTIRIVILTGYASIATAVEAIKMGVVHYFTKPVDAEDIVTALLEDQINPQLSIEQQPPSVKRLEWEHIHKVLSESDGNVSEAARRLGMHRRTLQRKLNKHPVKR